MQPQFAAMTVVGPDGNLWSTGDPEVDGAVVSVGVRPLGPAGTYTVNYRATSADGHVVSGSWSFRLTVAGTGTSGAVGRGRPSEHANTIPVWPFYAGAVLIVGAGPCGRCDAGRDGDGLAGGALVVAAASVTRGRWPTRGSLTVTWCGRSPPARRSSRSAWQWCRCSTTSGTEAS